MEEGLADRTSLAPQQQQLVQPGGYFCYGGATGEKNYWGVSRKILTFWEITERLIADRRGSPVEGASRIRRRSRAASLRR